ncbi:MAG: F0F1 ATP synthase subunit epsilon [Xanthomonadaceae bacterium]|nr:F0F1 ATP synthase subunit epsilon [Xanthomonadaceae bacterium]
MAQTMQLDIVSAEKSIFSGAVEFVSARAVHGDVGILPRHAPLLVQLQPGEVRVKMPGGEEEYFYVSGGIMEVQPNIVTVLADTAARAKDLDEAAALEAKARAERALKDRSADIDYAKAQAELAAAMAQLRAIQNLRKNLR